MLLSMTKDGRVYQASGDRADGMGFGRGAQMVSEGDVALTKPALTAEKMRQGRAAREQNQKRKAQLISLSKARAKKAVEARTKAAKALGDAAWAEKKIANFGEDPLLREAIQQSMYGADFEQLSLAGNGMTADGKRDLDKGMGFGMDGFFDDLLAKGTSFIDNVVNNAPEVVASVVGDQAAVAAMQQQAAQQAAAAAVQQAAALKAQQLAQQQALAAAAQASTAQNLLTKYKKEVMIGGAVAGALILVLLLRR